MSSAPPQAIRAMTGEVKKARRKIWVDLLLYPTHTLPTAAAPVLVATGLALHDGVFAPLPVFLAFLGSWFIHVAGVFTDNHELLRRHPGIAEHPELLRALDEKSLRFGWLRIAIAGCFLAGVLSGLYLVWVGGFPVVIIGAVGLLASFAYAGGAFAYARLGLADPIFFLMFGVLAVAGGYYIQLAAHVGIETFWLGAIGSLGFEALLVGLPIGALVTAVLVIDDIRDIEFDARKGWRTTAVRFGIRGSRVEFQALLLFAYLAPVWLWLLLGFSPWVSLVLLTLPEAWLINRKVADCDDRQELLPTTPRTARLGLVYAFLLAVGLVPAA